MALIKKYYLGTSGWNYKHWMYGVFYPEKMSQSKWLAYYSSFFNTVEVNVTFYRTVPPETFKHWHATTPADFSFVLKAPRVITHSKKLLNAEEQLQRFLASTKPLKKKLKAILWQLPETVAKDVVRLEKFLKLLKKSKAQHVFEFRNATWFDEEVYALLKEYNACLCIADTGDAISPKVLTTDCVYIRFHGKHYGSKYTDSQLRQWAQWLKKAKAKESYIFFNNDLKGYAVQNALSFKNMRSL